MLFITIRYEFLREKAISEVGRTFGLSYASRSPKSPYGRLYYRGQGLSGIVIDISDPVRSLGEMKPKDEDDGDDLEEEDHRALHLSRIRVASLIVTLFQVTLYLGATDARQDYPGYAGLFFCAVLIAQGIIQASLERKFRKKFTTAPVTGQGRFLFRNLLWFAASGALYASVLSGFVITAALIAQYLFKHHGISGPLNLVILISGVTFGVAGGLGANFLAAPYFMRKVFSLSQGHPLFRDLKRQIQRSFIQVNLKPPRICMIEGDPWKSAQVFICGWARGKGPFRPAIFVSREIVENLTPMEVDAIIRHEVSHSALGHFRKRLSLSIRAILFSSFVSTGLFLIAAYLIESPQLNIFLAPLVAVGAFLMTCRSIQNQNYEHELAADIFSIEAFSGDADHLVSALRKLDHLNDLSSNRKDPRNFLVGTGHPVTELRIRRLRAHFAQLKAAQMKSQDDSDSDRRAA